MLNEYFKNYSLIYQFAYATVFPKHYVLNYKHGTNTKAKFSVCYRKWIDLKQQQQQQQPTDVVKRPLNYKNGVFNEFEQKPITEHFDFSVPKHQQLPLRVSQHDLNYLNN